MLGANLELPKNTSKSWIVRFFGTQIHEFTIVKILSESAHRSISAFDLPQRERSRGAEYRDTADHFW